MNRAEGSSLGSFHREICSRFSEIDSLCKEVMSFLEQKHLQACFNLELAVREAVNNAILHGNRGDEAKKVKLDFSIGRKWIRIAISDEGRGFDWRRARRLPLPDHTAVNGRGLHIASLCAAKVTHNRLGNRVTIWMIRAPKES